MTINEIAKLAGVSISTVSKIINNKDENIAPATRDRVLKIVKEYNYRPYANVVMNQDTRSFLLGVLLCAPSPLMEEGINEFARQNGYIALFLSSQGATDLELRQLSALAIHNLDGLIWEPADPGVRANLRHVENLGIPYLSVSRHSDADALGIDYAGLGYFLTRQLVDHKHRSIACLARPGCSVCAAMVEGFKKCLFDSGIAYGDDQVLTPDTLPPTALLVRSFSGVVCGSRRDALGLYKSLTELSLHVPDDLSLVCLGRDLGGELPYPAISSAAVPYRAFGAHLCRLLIDRCESRPQEEDAGLFAVEPELTGTGSIAPPPRSRTKRIIAVGALNMDIVLNVEELPAAGKTTLASSSLYVLGGKGANQAVGAARLGQEVVLFSKVGGDIDASTALGILNKENVSTRGIQRDTGEHTGRAYIQQQQDGESTITVVSGANGKLSADDLAREQHLFARGAYCLISTEIPMEAVVAAAEIARRHGVKTILKPAAVSALPAGLLELVDIFVPNRSEARTLCGDNAMTVEQQARLFHDGGAATVIITLGKHGCYYSDASGSGYLPASELFAIDTTGGADAFICALASYLMEGSSLERAIQIATVAAGFCISRIGVTTALVDKSSLESYIRRLRPDL